MRRALALDPLLGEAHATLGYQLVAFAHDWPAAEQAFRRSLELKLSLPLGHFALGQLLAIRAGGWPGGPLAADPGPDPAQPAARP